MESGEPYMTLQETADYMKVSRQWVSQRTHLIPHRKLGNKKIFKPKEVDLWLEAYRGGSPLALL